MEHILDSLERLSPNREYGYTQLFIHPQITARLYTKGYTYFHNLNSPNRLLCPVKRRGCGEKGVGK